MNETNDERLDIDAAEYALGTLRGRALERFERRLRDEPELTRRVREWEARLAPMVADHAPADSPASLWSGIERRLFGPGTDSPRAGALARWRRLAAGFAAAVVVTVGALVYQVAFRDHPQCYAVLADGRAQPVAVVFDRRNMRELVVLPVGSRLVSAEGRAQLWIVVGGTSHPVGFLSPDGETRLALDKPLLTAVMAPGARLLVTREPGSGAPSALPGAERIADGVVALLGAAAPPATPL